MRKIILFIVLILFSTLEALDKTTYFIGKWDGVTHRGAKAIQIEFLSETIKISINEKKALFKNIKYHKSKNKGVIVISKTNFNILGIKSNKFEVKKKYEGIGIYHNGYIVEELFPSNENTLLNGWDMKSHNIRNKKCIYPLVASCFDKMKKQSELYNKSNAKFSLKALKESQDAVFINLTNFDTTSIVRSKKISYDKNTIEYKKMDKCVSYLIDTYSPSDFWRKVYKNRQELHQEMEEQINK